MLYTIKGICADCGDSFVSVRSARPRVTNDGKHAPARFCTACSRKKAGWKKNETTKRSRKPADAGGTS